MILATCQHHNLKPYTFQSEFRIVYCCLVYQVIRRVVRAGRPGIQPHKEEACKNFCITFTLFLNILSRNGESRQQRKELQLNLKQEVCEDSGGASFFLSFGVNLMFGVEPYELSSSVQEPLTVFLRTP